MKIETSEYRIVKAEALSEVGKVMDADANAVKEKEAEQGERIWCLLCKCKNRKVPAVRFALGASWRHDGEELRFSFGVCGLHRGHWFWYPKNEFRAYDGMYRKTGVGEVIPSDEPFNPDLN